MAKPGLSVLIPIYNFSVVNLVNDLLSQFEKCVIDFEIRLYDDCSAIATNELNTVIAGKFGVVYSVLPQNLGRAKIRNLLAKEALFEYLLFLDCDCALCSNNFIKTYADLLIGSTVFAANGGRKYKSFANYDPENYLHWLVGKNREEKTAFERSGKPYGSFMLDNLLIQKQVFDIILLDDKIDTYGHEDTKFGFDLERRNIEILHLDNPTYHIGLNSAHEFLEKSNLAVIVLCKIIANEGIGKATSLYKMYDLLKKCMISGPAYYALSLFNSLIRKNLLSANPSLYCFDLYKLQIMLRWFRKRSMGT